MGRVCTTLERSRGPVVSDPLSPTVRPSIPYPPSRPRRFGEVGEGRANGVSARRDLPGPSRVCEGPRRKGSSVRGRGPPGLGGRVRLRRVDPGSLEKPFPVSGVSPFVNFLWGLSGHTAPPSVPHRPLFPLHRGRPGPLPRHPFRVDQGRGPEVGSLRNPQRHRTVSSHRGVTSAPERTQWWRVAGRPFDPKTRCRPGPAPPPVVRSGGSPSVPRPSGTVGVPRGFGSLPNRDEPPLVCRSTRPCPWCRREGTGGRVVTGRHVRSFVACLVPRPSPPGMTEVSPDPPRSGTRLSGDFGSRRPGRLQEGSPVRPWGLGYVDTVSRYSRGSGSWRCKERSPFSSSCRPDDRGVNDQPLRVSPVGGTALQSHPSPRRHGPGGPVRRWGLGLVTRSHTRTPHSRVRPDPERGIWDRPASTSVVTTVSPLQ